MNNCMLKEGMRIIPSCLSEIVNEQDLLASIHQIRLF